MASALRGEWACWFVDDGLFAWMGRCSSTWKVTKAAAPSVLLLRVRTWYWRLDVGVPALSSSGLVTELLFRVSL